MADFSVYFNFSHPFHSLFSSVISFPWSLLHTLPCTDHLIFFHFSIFVLFTSFSLLDLISFVLFTFFLILPFLFFPAFIWRPELCSGGGGRVWARSQTLCRRESLVLNESFNTLWCKGCCKKLAGSVFVPYVIYLPGQNTYRSITLPFASPQQTYFLYLSNLWARP